MALLEVREERDLFVMAQDRIKNSADKESTEFSSVLDELGIALEELDKAQNYVEIE